MADTSNDGVDLKLESDVSRAPSPASGRRSRTPSSRKTTGSRKGTMSASREREMKDLDGQYATVTVTIAVAYPKANDEQSRLVEDLVKKNKRTVDAPRPHQYLHCEYTMSPAHERTQTDVVTYAVAAKVFTETDSKVVKTWEDGNQVWVAWMNSHQVDISANNLMTLYNHTVDVQLWDSKEKVSSKARTDRPKAFRMPSGSDHEFPGRGVQAVVAKQSRSWESVQPRDSVIDTAGDKTEGANAEPEVEKPEQEAQEQPAEPEALKDENQPAPQRKRVRSSLGRLAGVDATEEEQRRFNELKKQQARLQKQLAKNRRNSAFERLSRDEGDSRREKSSSRKERSDTRDQKNANEGSASALAARRGTEETGNEVIADAGGFTGGDNDARVVVKKPSILQQAKRGRVDSERPSKSNNSSKFASVPVKLEHWFSGSKTLTSRLKEQNGAIQDVLVSVSLDTPLLSEEVERTLNPLVINLQAVKDLPSTPVPYNILKSTCEPVYCKYNFLGHPLHTTSKRPHGKHVYFEDTRVILLGKLNEGELREFIQGHALEVEVHDRDQKDEEKPAEPSIFGEERMDEKISDIGVISGKRTTFNALQSRKKAYDPYGVAKVSLIDLLKGQTTLNLRVNVNPCSIPEVVRDPSNTDANTRLVGIPGAVDRPERPPQPTGHYFQAGTTLKLRITLPFPLVPPPNVPRVLPLPTQLCPFSRVIYVFSYNNKDFLKRIEDFVTTTNAIALDLGNLPKHVMEGALSTYKLTSEQKRSQTLDIITGFHVIDGDVHVMVLEGLREGAMQHINDRVVTTATDDSNAFTRLFDTSMTFSVRLYSALDVDLCRVRLHQTIGEILEQPLLYVRDMVPKLCLDCITKVDQITRMTRLRDVVFSNLFPTAQMVISMSREFGVPLTFDDFEHHHKMTPEPTVTMSKKSPSPVEHEKRRWTPLDNINRPYVEHLKERFANADERPNYVMTNIVAVQEAGRRRRPLHPSVRSLTSDLPAYNYSTQTLNSTVLGKDVLRSMLAEKDSSARYAYHADYNSAMVDPVNVDAYHRQRDEDAKRAWRTKEGFVYPGVKSSRQCNVHPRQVDVWRISELNLPFRDNVLHRNILMPTLDRERLQWEDRAKDMELYRRAPVEFNQEPVTIHMAGDLKTMEEVEFKQKETETWKSRVVVDDVRMRFHRLLGATEQSNASNQLDKLTEQLKDNPMKLSLRRKPAPVIPPLSVVANSSVDTAARARGVPLSPAFNQANEQNVGFMPGPFDDMRWVMERNKIPIKDEQHSYFAKLRRQDMNLYHKERSLLWKGPTVRPLTEDEKDTHYFHIPPAPAKETRAELNPEVQVNEARAEEAARLAKSEYRFKFSPYEASSRAREIYPRPTFHGFVPLTREGKPLVRDASIQLVGSATVKDVEESKRNVTGMREKFGSVVPQHATVEIAKQPVPAVE